MKLLPLDAKDRDKLGKRKADKLRKNDWIPAVLYGGDMDTRHLKVDRRDFREILRSKTGERSFLHLKFNGKEKDAIIKEVQYEPVSGKALHIDFEHIPEGKEIEFYVGLDFTGTPHGVIEGGVFSTQIREVPVKTDPRDLPDVIEVEVSDLEIDEALHVSAIELEEGEILLDEHMTIASVVPPSEVIEEEEEVEEEIELAMVEGEEVEGEEVEEGEEGEEEEGEEGERPEGEEAREE